MSSAFSARRKLTIGSNIEFTAGLLVCCMPSTKKVFNHMKSPVPPLISPLRRVARSVIIPEGWTLTRLSTATSLEPNCKFRKDEDDCEIMDDKQKAWARRGDLESR